MDNIPQDVTSRDGHADSISLHSNSPLRQHSNNTYPPLSPPMPDSATSHDPFMRHVPMPGPASDEDTTPMNQSFANFNTEYDAERAQAKMYPGGAGMPQPNASQGSHHSGGSKRQSHLHHPTGSRNGSWDLLAGIRKFEHSYEEFDTRNASQAHLAFADGDTPKNKV